MLRFLTVGVVAMLWLAVNQGAWASELDDIYRLADQKQFSQAMEKLVPYLNANPKDAQGRFLKGLILTEQKQREDAILIFKSLSEDYPDLPEPYNNLAVLYAEKGLYDQASDALKKAIQTHPSYATAHENLGDIYAKMASQAYSKALSLDAENQAAQTKLDMVRKLFSQQGVDVPVGGQGIAKSPVVTESVSVPAVKLPEVLTKKEEKAAGGIQGEVEQVVLRWAKAWSEKDVQGYLDAYSPNFQVPAPFSNMSSWVARRRQVISKAGSIQVTVSGIKIHVLNPQRAQAVFIQRYRSPGYQDQVNKSLSLVLENGRWKITRESSDS